MDVRVKDNGSKMEKIVDYSAYKKEWLDGIENNSSSSQNAHDRFAEKLFSQWLEIDESSKEDFYSLKDLGFSFAYYFEGDGKEENSSDEIIWYIVYSGYNRKDFSHFTERLEKLIEFLEEKKKPTKEYSEVILQLSKFISKVKRDPFTKKIVITIVTDNDNYKENFETIKNTVEQFDFLSFELVNIRTIHNRILDENQRTADFYLKATLKVVGAKLLIGSMQLRDFYDFLKNYKSNTGDLDLIYQKNVRRYLGSKNKVNKEIQNTLLSHPDEFGLCNKGITMVVGAFEEKGNDNYYLIEPFIVNGCQTSKTIWDTLSRKFRDGNKDEKFGEWEQELDDSTVILKIVEVGRDKKLDKRLLSSITKFTNSQSTVKTSDFISLEEDFIRFHREMAERYSVYLEIQKGGWDSQQSLQKDNKNLPHCFDEKQFCNAFDLIKVYSSGWLEIPGKASGHNPPFAPGGSIFKKITDNEDPKNKIEVDDLYACYLLQREAIEIKFGRDAVEPWKARTKYLFYFTVIKILNDILIKLEFKPSEDKKIITKSLIHIFVNFPKLKSQMIEASLSLIEEYMTDGKDESIFTEPDFSKYKEIKDFFKLEAVGKTENYRKLLNIQIGIMKRAVNGEIPYTSILEKLKEMKAKVGR